MVATIYGAADRAYALVPVAVQTANYTAAANQFVPVNSTSAAITITLPTMPPDGTVIGVKQVAGANAVTVATGSPDVFNVAGGPTSVSMPLSGQGLIAQYSSGAGIWYVKAEDLPLAQLDSRYVQQSAAPVQWFNVKAAAYGATGNGTTDDTAAVASAINACSSAGGGIVWFPPGTYLLTPTSSPALSVPSNVKLVGAGRTATVLKKAANGILISMSGPSSDLTGATHCRFSAIEALGINGNGKTGLALQLYYADNLIFRDLAINNNNDLTVDTAEFWDSRFEDVAIVSCTGTAGSTTQPNVLIRNSAAASGFGNTTGSSNQIHFRNCRFEAFGTGALWVAQGPGNSANFNGLYVTDCKFEGDAMAGGPYISTDNTTKNCFFEHVYVYAGGFASGWSTAETLVSLFGGGHALRDCAIGNGASANVVNGVLAHAVGGSTIVLEDIVGGYGTAPTTAHVNFDASATGRYSVKNCPTNLGTQYAGTLPALNYIPSQKPAAAATSTATVANTAALTALHTATVPANDPGAGAVYVVEGWGVYSDTGTPTLAFGLYWGGVAGTLLASIPAITLPSSVTNVPFTYKAQLVWQSATACAAVFTLDLATSAATDAASAYVGSPSAAVTGLVTTSAQSLTVGVTWSAASTSNTISLLGGHIRRVA